MRRTSPAAAAASLLGRDAFDVHRRLERAHLCSMAAGVFFHWVQVFGVLLSLLSFQSLPAAGETRRSHYETLHVDPTATDSQIKKSFRKLALKYHPDKREGADAERRFREIVEGKTQTKHCTQ